MKHAVVLGLIAAPLLAGCGHLPWGADRPTVQAPMPGQLEPLHAAAFGKDVAVFWVTSNGCTDKADLKPIVSRQGGEAVITLRRLEEDRCDRPLADGVEVKWSFEELGLIPGDRISVNNPLQLPQT
ncbi:MAG TPA: hypothetical protein PLQ03_09605 [Brevundimonas sp.]|uniref:hypothetical protein n=1 Tax=Brevundimonas sp. TaxID=1871086 RepID=UPI00262EE981|nr:hypothetical protein [Brevundimonas sp.]HRO33651.1 hypothetical protein [Brevundimonas sp.]